jgi:RNA polymerase sigma factor (sigma-70 family)
MGAVLYRTEGKVPNNEKPTFESIVLEHGPFIRRTLAQLGVASADLRDVEQEVLRGVNRGLPTFDPELSANPSNALRGWLFAICERQAANHRRARLRRGELLLSNDELDASPGAGPSSEERLIAEQHKAILMHLLDKLEPQRRAVIVAYELEGIAMAEVAAAFSIPVNTAWNRLRLAREDLREAWERYEKKRRAQSASVALPPLPPLATLLTEVAKQNAAADAAATAGATAAPGAGAVGSGVKGAAARAALHVGAKLSAHAPLVTVLAAGAGLVLAGVLAGSSIQAASATSAPSAPYPMPEADPALAAASAAPSSDVAVGAQNTAAMSADPQNAASDVPKPAATVAAAPATTARATSGSGSPSRAEVVRPRPARDVALEYERRRIAEAQVALARGDVETAEKSLEILDRSFASGSTADEREVLSVRRLLLDGRRNEAIARARSYLAANPKSAARAALEQLIGPASLKPMNQR